MDYLTAHHSSQPLTTVSPSVDPFAQEIGRRFQAQSLLTPRLSPVATTPGTRLGNLSLRSKPSSPILLPSVVAADTRLIPVLPDALDTLINSDRLLVLDIRSHGTFTQSRLPHALSLSVPSTLLKRPAFSLQKLSEMLPSASARRHFASWRSASRILVYDADSQNIPEGSNIRGLLRKFEIEGFDGDLLWLKGGFAALWRDSRNLVDDTPPSPETSEEEDSPSCFLRAKKLPSSAFQQVSTTTASQRPKVRPVPVQVHHQVAPAPTFNKPVPANPFYDVIRQNRELEQGITERIPLRFPAALMARRDDLPFDWLKDIVDKADTELGTEALAMQFYMIELREQRRLMGIMDHHSRETMAAGRAASFPYSITAGVEKGSKNRYTNIWPFEHARVRLNACSPDDGSDYINASYVQPLGTDRRYIATQGPLPTTYTDFWTLCWEQQTRIIIMLTKEVEGATVKCGSYWTEKSYGPLRLELVSSSQTEQEPVAQPGFDFSLPATKLPPEPIVRRTFLLSHTEYPDEPPRKITQLQYLSWPDFDVPEDPRGLLNLMREVDALRAEAEDQGPVLLHCSAGIGRTGGFIVMDAALDGVRREMRLRRMGKASTATRPRDIVYTASPTSMEVDVDSSPSASHRTSMSFQNQNQSGREMSLSPGPRSDSARQQFPQMQDSGTDTSGGLLSDDSLHRSLSTRPSSAAGSSTGAVRSSVFAPPDVDLCGPSPSKRARPPRLSLGEPCTAVRRFRAALAAGPSSSPSSSTSTTTVPSVFGSTTDSKSLSMSTAPTAPVSEGSSRAASPAKDAALSSSAPLAAFDYTEPRRLNDSCSAELLSSFAEPVRKLLEDMREQRMSLCQSLRQYVFVHRAIVEGAIDIVDEENARERGEVGAGKRGPSPTELVGEDGMGAVRLSKRPSMKRRDRSDEGDAGARVATVR